MAVYIPDAPVAFRGGQTGSSNDPYRRYRIALQGAVAREFECSEARGYARRLVRQLRANDFRGDRQHRSIK